MIKSKAATYPNLGNASSRLFSRNRNSGIMLTIRNTLKTLIKRATNTISASLMGIRLTTIIKVLNIFHPWVKNFRFSSSPR